MLFATQPQPPIISNEPSPNRRPFFRPFDEELKIIVSARGKPPPLPESYMGLQCVYGYELTDTLFANCEPYVSQKDNCLTSQSIRRIRSHLLYELAHELRIFSPTIRFLPGRVLEGINLNILMRVTKMLFTSRIHCTGKCQGVAWQKMYCAS